MITTFDAGGRSAVVCEACGRCLILNASELEPPALANANVSAVVSTTSVPRRRPNRMRR
jgi:hypothetical protein